MARSTKKFGHPRQLTIRDYLCLDPADQLKIAMSEALKNSGMSRAQVVDEINRLAAATGIRNEGRNGSITEAILDKWVSRGSTAHHIPVRYLPIFCQATASAFPLEALLPPGMKIIDEEDENLLRWARVEVERRKLSKAARRLAQEAGLE